MPRNASAGRAPPTNGARGGRLWQVGLSGPLPLSQHARARGEAKPRAGPHPTRAPIQQTAIAQTSA
eukprot:scaffold2685_cov101-Isochrysis_galbana.AAC.3